MSMHFSLRKQKKDDSPGQIMSVEQISDLQRKRAVNIIWNSAEDYGFTPDFKAYDADGKAELYFNSIIGAVRKHYDYSRIENVFRGVQKYEESDIYESLLWLALENAVFGREVKTRPVLEKLRKEYARSWLAGSSASEDQRLCDRISRAHFEKVLGLEPGLDPYNAELLKELEFSPELETDEIVERAEALLEKWFFINTKEAKTMHLRGLRREHRGNRKKKVLFRRFGGGFAEHPDNAYDGRAASDVIRQYSMLTKMSEAELREFIRFKYGRPILDPAAEKELEKQLCKDSHMLCHLHLTRGEEYEGRIQNAFEALQKQRESRQRERNREYYASNMAANRTAISRLCEKIRNSILLYLQEDDIKSDSGKLKGGRTWRAEQLGDGRIFERREREAAGDLSVDILLDASNSQKDRQETVSSQGYIIAESLTRCGIPCRVCSFCSMTGYTIIRVFRDYTENAQNARIFDFVSNGCNRDGLAVRVMTELMKRAPYEHRLLIILSDVKPNDVSRMPADGEDRFVDYSGEAGVTNTASEVRKARAEGISAVCVFTGEDEDLASARLIYGGDFARIQSMDMLAETVGKLILNCIRNL